MKELIHEGGQHMNDGKKTWPVLLLSVLMVAQPWTITMAANIADSVVSSGGAPTRGWCDTDDPDHNIVRINGGYLGPNGYNGTCARALFKYDMGDAYGYPLMFLSYINDAAPFVSFGVSRKINGIRANASWIIQRDSGPPGYEIVGPYAGAGVVDPTSPLASAPHYITSDVNTMNAGGFYGITTIIGLNRTLYIDTTDANAPGLIQAFGNAQCCPTSGAEVWRLQEDGHQHVGGAGATGTLSVHDCGTGSPSIVGADTAFVITLGSDPTSCTVSFKHAWTSSDLTCTFISEADSVGWKFTKVGSAKSWTGVTFTASRTLTSFSKVHGLCVGHV
jgi:hypothetical protein